VNWQECVARSGWLFTSPGRGSPGGFLVAQYDYPTTFKLEFGRHNFQVKLNLKVAHVDNRLSAVCLCLQGHAVTGTHCKELVLIPCHISPKRQTTKLGTVVRLFPHELNFVPYVY
jgi:hypothetical protein